jgi:hypothetical protein
MISFNSASRRFAKHSEGSRCNRSGALLRIAGFCTSRWASPHRLLANNAAIFERNRAVRFSAERRVVCRQKNCQTLLSRKPLEKGND